MLKGIKKIASFLIIGTIISGFCSINISAEEIANNDFEDGSYLPWHTYVGEFAEAGAGIKDGKYQIEILNPGGINNGGVDRWDIQLRYRGFNIQWGHRYKLKYEVTSTNDGSFYTAIGEIGGGEEVWHNNSTDLSDYAEGWGRVKVTAGKTKTIELVFMPTKSLETAEWSFSVGGEGKYTATECFPAGTILTFDNILLEDMTMDNEPMGFNERVSGNFIYSVNDKTINLLGVTNTFRSTDMVIPAYIKNTPVSEISSSVYHDFFFEMLTRKNLKSVTIPNTVTAIEDKTLGFYNAEPIEGFVIKGERGTEAEAYAERNGLVFEETIMGENKNNYKNFLLNRSEFYYINDNNDDNAINVFDFLKDKMSMMNTTTLNENR